MKEEFFLTDEFRKFTNYAWENSSESIQFEGETVYLKCIDQFGGEGQGDDYWIVFELTHKDKTTVYKLDGWYASYHGHEFDSYIPYEVKRVPVQKYEWHSVE